MYDSINDLIFRRDVLYHKRRYIGQEYDEPYYVDGVSCEVIRRLPAADVAPIIHGHWIYIDECNNSGWYCSECKKKIFEGHSRPKKKLLQYCANCGAKMDGEIEFE